MTHYRPSPRYPRYWAGEDGTIIGPRGRKLVPTPNKDGYLQIGVWVGGKSKSIRVNVLICETFHGPRLPGMDAAHIDGDRGNNYANNLEWKSHKDNDADKDTHGTRARGELNGQSKLTEGDIRFIRRIYAAGVKNIPQLAAIYRMDKSGVSKIIKRQRWRHVL
jgi:hypothetical protein